MQLLTSLYGNNLKYQNYLISSDVSEYWAWISVKPSLYQPNSTHLKVHITKIGDDVQTKNAKEFRGPFKSAFISKDALYIIYAKTIYKISLDKKEQRLAKKAPDSYFFLAASLDEKGKLLTLLAKDTHLFLSKEQQAIKPLSSIKIDRQDLLMPISYHENISILIKKHTSKETTAISIPSHSNNNIKISPPVQFDFSTFSSAHSTIYLISSKDSKAMTWNQDQWQKKSFEEIFRSKKSWLSTAKVGASFYHLLSDQNSYTLLTPKGQQEINSQRKINKDYSPEDYITSQFIYLTIFITVLILLIRFRRIQLLKLSHLIPSKINTPAHIFIRASALFIDVILIKPISEITYYYLIGPDLILFDFAQPINDWQELINSEMLQIFQPLVWIMIAILLLYLSLMELFFEASLGKMFFHMKVIQDNGERIQIRQILIKSFSRMIDIQIFPISLILCIISQKNKSLGDHLAKTTVVRTW